MKFILVWFSLFLSHCDAQEPGSWEMGSWEGSEEGPGGWEGYERPGSWEGSEEAPGSWEGGSK